MMTGPPAPLDNSKKCWCQLNSLPPQQPLYSLASFHYRTSPPDAGIARRVIALGPTGLALVDLWPPGLQRLWGLGATGPSPDDVVEVVDGVVDEVAAERFHGEGRAVGAAAGAEPLVGGEGGEAVG